MDFLKPQVFGADDIFASFAPYRPSLRPSPLIKACPLLLTLCCEPLCRGPREKDGWRGWGKRNGWRSLLTSAEAESRRASSGCRSCCPPSHHHAPSLLCLVLMRTAVCCGRAAAGLVRGDGMEVAVASQGECMRDAHSTLLMCPSGSPALPPSLPPSLLSYLTTVCLGTRSKR